MTTLVDILVDRSATAASQYVTLVSKADASVYQATAPSTDPTTLNPGQFSITPKPPAGAYLMYLGATQGAQTRLVDSEYVVDPFDDTGLATFPHGVTVSAGPVTLPALSIADAALSSKVVLTDTAQTVTGVKHFSAAPIFDAGFSVSAGLASFAAGVTVSAGAVTLPARSIADGALSTNVALLNGGQTFSVAPTFSLGANFPSGAGVVTFGGGDDVSYYVGGTPFEMDARQGTAASPITTGSGPTFKISRTESITAASMPAGIGSNNQGNAGLWVSATGDAANEVQVNAILGTATTQSTVVAGGGKNHDVVGVQGFGSVFGSGIGTGGGGYFEGRRDTNTGNANGIEVRVRNQTATDGVYNSTGFSNTVGVWVTADGQTNRVSGVALGVGIVAANSAQWDVGLGFTTMSGISSVKTTTISDDTNSVNSLIINGTHTRAIGIKAGAGPILIGHPNATDAATNAATLLEVFSASSADGLIALQGSGNVNVSMKIGNSSGSLFFGYVGTAGSYLASTVAGDAILRPNTTGKALHIGGGQSPFTKIISVTADNTLGFFAATPVAQYATTGTATGFTAGAGTAVTHLSTFTGNTGATAYTIADMVRAMKLYGLVAA